jgi:hypothetical protein
MTLLRHAKRTLLVGILTTTLTLHAWGQIGGMPGAPSRMGFGARGMGLGNAMTAVARGDIVGYSNPALLPWAEYRQAGASFGILSLDRSLNFLYYTQPLQPQAGLSVGIINSGVSDIDGRDSDGLETGVLKTSENQAFLSFGIRTKPGLSLGITLKFLYYHLYTDMNSLTVALDFGAYYPVSDDLSVGATVRDINGVYKWDSSKLYDQLGGKTDDAFPQLYTVGAAYRLPDSIATVSMDCEVSSSARTIILRTGIEVPIIRELSLRAGMDRIDLREKGNGVRPAFGFSTGTTLGSWTPSLHYAFVLEPFAPSGLHMISLSARF